MGTAGPCSDGEEEASPHVRAAKQKAGIPVPLPSWVTAPTLAFGK